MKLSEYVVQESEGGHDLDFLHRKMFDVDIRLFKSSTRYRDIIINIINYMEWHLGCTFEDYSPPRGVSACQLGIPFNIIAYKDNQNRVRFCLNPVIVNSSKETTNSYSNCGSMRLPQSVSVDRSNIIDLEFYDLNGNKVLMEGITRDMGGFIIQHEVEHGLGITVADRAKK